MNFHLLGFALHSIKRSFKKSIFIFSILFFMTFLLATVFFIVTSLRYETQLTLDALPDIILQKTRAELPTPLSSALVDEILEIRGVEAASDRVWGYYYFESAQIYITVVGVDEFEVQNRAFIAEILNSKSLSDDGIIVGRGLFELLKKYHYEEYFNFIKEDGSVEKLYISGLFSNATAFESNDIALVHKAKAREILGLKDGESSDIAIDVANPEELPNIALKLTQNYPNYRIITKEDLSVSYAQLFNYKSGIFLALFVVAFFTFFIIIYDRLTSINGAQRREIGILKAVGFSIQEVVRLKLYESLILSFGAYLLGVFCALLFVYIFDAPLLRDIFMSYSHLKNPFELSFVFDSARLFFLFLVVVVLYVLATIIPAWRVATLDVKESIS